MNSIRREKHNISNKNDLSRIMKKAFGKDSN